MEPITDFEIIVYAFLFIILITGIFTSDDIKTPREFTIADKSLGIFVITLTIMATAFGGGSLLGSVEEVTSNGFTFVIVSSLSGFIAISLIAFFIAPKFLQQKYYSAISISDIICYHYGKFFGIFSGIVGYLYSAGILGIQMAALGHILSAISDLKYEVLIVSITVVLTIYSSRGGIRSIAITSGVQFFAIATVIPVLTIITINKAGGFDVVFTKVIESLSYDTSAYLKFDYTLYFLIEVSTLTWLFPAMGQIFLASQNKNELRKGLLTYAAITIVFMILMGFLAFSGKILYPNVPPKELIANIVSNHSVIIKGFAIVAIIAMIMSTADAFLNAASVLLVHNVLKPWLKIKNEIKWMVLTSFFIGMLSMMTALHDIHIVPIIASSDSLWVSYVVIPLLAGLFNLKTDKEAYISSTISGTIVYLIMKFTVKDLDFLMPFSVIVSSLVAFLLAHLIINGKITFVKKEDYKNIS